MFRSAQIVTSACLMGTHRSLLGTVNSCKKKNLRETVCSTFLSQPICIARSKRGPQRKHYFISEPKSSEYVSQRILRKPFSFPVQTSCSINAAATRNLPSMYKITQSVQDFYIFSAIFILRDPVSEKCRLPKNHTGKHRHSVDNWKSDVNSSIKNQKSCRTTGHTPFTKSNYELNKGLWTSCYKQWSRLGPLTSQTCGLHRRAPQQAAFEDCLSAKNEERCRGCLQSNTTLYEKERGKKWAAVLVSLCTVGGEPSLLFTLRSSKLRGRHKGDVSFAGGKQDPSDRNIVETALREAREELGISVTENEVWGVLKPLSDASGMVIAPVIANLGPRETLMLRPNPTEVEEIFTLTVAHLCNPQNRGYTHFRTGNRYGYTLPVFHSEKYRIWGLTAIALDHTLKLIMPE